MNNFYRVTVWDEGHEIAESLGLIPDQNSNSFIFEWYYTFENEKDCLAFTDFLVQERGEDPNLWIAHKFSVWNTDPRLN